MIAVVDSGGANVSSVMLALERATKNMNGAEAVFTFDPNVIRNASHVILPGVGAAATAMKALQDKGLVDVLRGLTQPVMGICLGMQLLFSRSAEGDVDCLDIIDGQLEHFDLPDLSVPHTGWNQVMQVNDNPLFKDIPDESYFYFVHSYFLPQNDAAIGNTDYGGVFTSAVNHNNFYGCQFHPERSGVVGEQLIRNFLSC